MSKQINQKTFGEIMREIRDDFNNNLSAFSKNYNLSVSEAVEEINKKLHTVPPGDLSPFKLALLKSLCFSKNWIKPDKHLMFLEAIINPKMTDRVCYILMYDYFKTIDPTLDDHILTEDGTITNILLLRKFHEKHIAWVNEWVIRNYKNENTKEINEKFRNDLTQMIKANREEYQLNENDVSFFTGITLDKVLLK